MIAKSHRWQKTVMAAAATALIGLYGSPASALSLGRVTVQSALGEPLRAEIDVPDINAEEAATLQARAASPEAFQAAGLEYNPAIANLKATLLRRANGRAYIRLSSDRAISDPFVDMILEASWASGRIVRDYTMLFDPPSLKQTLLPVPTAPQVPAPPTASRSTATKTPLARSPDRPVEAAKPAPQATPPAAAVPKSPPAAGTMTVKAGDTAGQIAAATKPLNVSLDQMLVAILRANPDAFLRDNVNRIRAGAILNLPTAEQAAATTDAEARQVIVAQSKDFNDFRRKLAGSAPLTQVTATDRTASGSVTAQVQDKQTTAPAPDKLTLSKGSVQGQLGEDQLAKARSAQDSSNRAAEIAKNISDLSKLEAASGTVAAGTVGSAASAAAPAQTTSAPTVAVAAPSAAGSAAVAASAPAEPASKPAAPSPLPAVEPGLMEELSENPLVPAGAVALIALLAGLGYNQMRKRKGRHHVDSSFLESHLKPESFFGASGGQSVDTHDNTNGSSLVYSHSQLDSADAVDPVAEADVYLAYGRDLQAEEILKDALRSNPSRIAIHEKLLEIFAKRNDVKGFEDIAKQAFKLTEGTSTEWAHICEMGLKIDPANALYQPGGQPNITDDSPSAASAPSNSDGNVALAAVAVAVAEEEFQPSSAVDLDLDLDFSVDDEPASAITEVSASNQEAVRAEPENAMSTALDLEFDVPTLDETPPEVATEPPVKDDFSQSGGIDFSLPEDETPAQEAPVESNALAELEETESTEFSLDFDAPKAPTTQEEQEKSADEALPTFEPTLDIEDFKVQAATSFGSTVPAPLAGLDPAPAPGPNLGMLEFDLGSLSLDLEEPAELTNEEASMPDPLATKLALAEEFSAIGDDDGARALIEEVISEASGDMKLKAQRALSNL